MELLDRYQQAVRLWLPRAQQTDIVAELSEDIRSQIEDREAELGRKLDESELGIILQQRGHPLLVASRYLPQQYLIGPALFSTYRFALKALLLGVMVPVFVLVIGPIAVFTADDPGRALLAALGGLWHAVIYSAGILTLVFALLDRHQVSLRFLDRWNPRRLPALSFAPNSEPKSRLGPVIELVIVVIFTAWWLDVLWYQTLYNADGLTIALAAVWRSYRLPIFFLSLVSIVIVGLNVSWPYPSRLISGIRLARDMASVILAFPLLKAGPWIVVNGPNIKAAALDELAKWANRSVLIALVTIGIISLVGVLLNLRRIVRLKPIRAVMVGV